jgi:CheY-like chemotaxis protein
MGSGWAAHCARCAWTSGIRRTQVAAEVVARLHKRDFPAHRTVASGVQALHAGANGRMIGVLVVDDHSVVRKALVTMLAQEPDLEIVGEAGDGKVAVEMTRALRPDVVLMDISLPLLNGIAATRAIHTSCPGVRVIGLSMFDHGEQAQSILEAGAAGYVSKTEAPDMLLKAIRSCGAAAQTHQPGRPATRAR